jgi:hypothetical protein
MKKYKVLIQESNSGTLYVEAKNAKEAQHVAQGMIDDGKVPDGTIDEYTSGYQIQDVQEDENPDESNYE